MDRMTSSSGSIRHESESTSASGRRHLTVTVGLFFDGTGYNANNTLKRLANHHVIGEIRKQYAENSEVVHPGDISRSSYDNYTTNIYRLFTLYNSSHADRNNHQYGVYISGIGTHSGKADTISGFAIGEGKSGAIAKTDEALSALTAVLQKMASLAEEKIVVDSLIFDLFGFSRGAAAARHFANRVLSRDPALVAAIVEGFNGMEYRGLPTGSTRFLGLFDCVAGVANLANGFDTHSPDCGGVELGLPAGAASRIFQISAGHEFRYNFSLNSIAPDYPELTLPGAHSDIGGGYNPQEEEYLFLSRPAFNVVPLDSPDAQADAVHQASGEMRTLLDNPSLEPLLSSGKLSIESWHDMRLSPDPSGHPRKLVGAAVALQRTLSNDWAKVTLRVMADAAREAGVRLAECDNSDPDYRLPPELEPLCDFALRQGQRVRKGESPQAFSHDNLRIIGRYIHCSAHWNAVEKSFFWHKDRWESTVSREVRPAALLSYLNRPEEGWTRTLHATGSIKR